jgi:hypothetical protein
MTTQMMKAKPDFNIYIINDNADMKATLDFNIYIINDNTDDESKTGFQYLHY